MSWAEETPEEAREKESLQVTAGFCLPMAEILVCLIFGREGCTRASETAGVRASAVMTQAPTPRHGG